MVCWQSLFPTLFLRSQNKLLTQSKALCAVMLVGLSIFMHIPASYAQSDDADPYIRGNRNQHKFNQGFVKSL